MRCMYYNNVLFFSIKHQTHFDFTYPLTHRLTLFDFCFYVFQKMNQMLPHQCPSCLLHSSSSVHIITSSRSVQQAQNHSVLQIKIHCSPETSPQVFDRHHRKLYTALLRLPPVVHNQGITAFTQWGPALVLLFWRGDDRDWSNSYNDNSYRKTFCESPTYLPDALRWFVVMYSLTKVKKCDLEGNVSTVLVTLPTHFWMLSLQNAQ